jgi:hypothetical protein
VEVTATDNGTTDIGDTRRVSSVVPNGAKSATIALRINTECDCSGAAQVGFGPISYQDDRTGQQVQRILGRPGFGRFTVRSGEPLGQNTPTFPVSEGNPYTLEIPMRASYGSGNSGYVAIIFLDGQNTQVANKQVWLEPGKVSAGKTTTDESGEFQFDPAPNILSLRASYLMEFPGNETHRYSEQYVP